MGTREVALMGWRIVKQPDGLYARFADPVDNFTHYNMTREEAVELCREYLGRVESEEKVANADKDINWDGTVGRWQDSLRTIRVIHGEDAVKEALQLLDIKSQK